MKSNQLEHEAAALRAENELLRATIWAGTRSGCCLDVYKGVVVLLTPSPGMSQLFRLWDASVACPATCAALLSDYRRSRAAIAGQTTKGAKDGK